MDVTKLSEVELKGLAYDQMVELERIQNNLVIIQRELDARKQPKDKEKPKTTPKN